MVRKPVQNLVFDDMTFGYEGGQPLFEKISFELPKAKAVWVRSPGGRGKSTLLKLLAGLVMPQSGRYTIDGVCVNNMSFEEFLPYRMNIGYGFESGGLLNNRSLAENLLLPLQYHKLTEYDDAQGRVLQAMEMFGMTQVQGLRPFAVSGSQRKLTCMIRALITWPQVVLLDDPVTGLKADNLNDLFYYVEESFATRGLRQMFFTCESPVFADRFKAEELMISTDWFMTRATAA